MARVSEEYRADRFGVDQIAAVGSGEVQLALRGLLDHETRFGVGHQHVAR